MVLPVPSGERGLAFRAFGFPVRIDPFFFLIMAFLGFSPGFGVAGIFVFLATAVAAVLLHELGHAFAARSSGHDASIVLYGFGGATTHRGPGLSRARGALISFAGPGLGLVVGIPLYLARDSFPDYGLGLYAWYSAVFLTLGLAVLNLLPIPPLDGGQLLQNALPGDHFARARLAAAIGIAVAVAGGLLAYAYGFTFSVIIAVWLAVGNVTTLRQRRPKAAMPVRALEQAAMGLVDAGRVDQAIHLIVTSTNRDEVDAAVIGLVRLANGDEAGWAQTLEAADEAPHDAVRAACLVRGAVIRGDFELLINRAGLDPALLRWAADRAVLAGREDVAARLAPTL